MRIWTSAPLIFRQPLVNESIREKRPLLLDDMYLPMFVRPAYRELVSCKTGRFDNLQYVSKYICIYISRPQAALIRPVWWPGMAALLELSVIILTHTSPHRLDHVQSQQVRHGSREKWLRDKEKIARRSMW
jgi:hypothetical protein